MTVAAISGSSTAANTAATRQSLGQADFIRLMTTQMQMQDPTDPIDNKEMIAQMAQFSSLAGIENVNSTLQQISAQLNQVLTAQTITPSPVTPA
jgi:flagellar basal-body rod modification protein FlgD